MKLITQPKLMKWRKRISAQAVCRLSIGLLA
jgi:hypothetical protein